MNFDVICPRCYNKFTTSIADKNISNYNQKIRCSVCGKSFLLRNALGEVEKDKKVEKLKIVQIVGQDDFTMSRKKKRSKWSRKADGELFKRIKRRR